jgi:hypothetical protein
VIYLNKGCSVVIVESIYVGLDEQLLYMYHFITNVVMIMYGIYLLVIQLVLNVSDHNVTDIRE